MPSWPKTQVTMLTAPPFSWFSAWVMAIVAHRCWACHHRSGTSNATAIAAPARNQRFQSIRRPPLSRAPIDHRDGEKARAVIVGHPEAGDQAAGQPPAAVAGPPDPGHDERQARPRQQLVGRRVGDMSGAQQDRHRRRPDRGQQLRAPAAAELARGEPADHHRGPRRRARPQPQAGQRHAEQLERHPGQQRRQHRADPRSWPADAGRRPGSTARRGESHTAPTAPSAERKRCRPRRSRAGRRGRRPAAGQRDLPPSRAGARQPGWPPRPASGES